LHILDLGPKLLQCILSMSPFVEKWSHAATNLYCWQSWRRWWTFCSIIWVEQVLDVAGAAGHLYFQGSTTIIEPVFQAFKTVHEVSIDIIEGNSEWICDRAMIKFSLSRVTCFTERASVGWVSVTMRKELSCGYWQWDGQRM
jgi:hypothetical protein